MADLNSTLVRGSLRVTDDAQVGGSISEGGTLLSNKYQAKLTTQTAYSAKGSATKVPQITTNTLGQVTGITEVNITYPADANTWRNIQVDGTEKLGTGTGTGALNFVSQNTNNGDISFTYSNGIKATAKMPSVGNGTLTIQKNGTSVATFTANQSGNSTANITVPTKTSDLTNDSGFLTGESDTLSTVTGRGASTSTEVVLNGGADITAGTLKMNVINAKTSSSSTTYGPGTSGQVLKSNGTNVYWGSDSSDTTTQAIGGNYKWKNQMAGYQVFITNKENKLVPMVSGASGSASTATTKTMNTESFDPFGLIGYTSSSSYKAADALCSSSTYIALSSLDMRYSFNCGTTLTTNAAVYIVAQMQSDGQAKLASPYYTQTLPSSDNGLIYIYLGQAISTSAINLQENHPVYYYKESKLRLFTTDLSKVSMTGSYNDLTNKPTIVNTVNSKSGAVTVSGSFSGTAATITPSLTGTKTFVTGYASFSGGSGSLTSNDTSTDGIAYIASHTNASLGTANTGTVGISGASYTPAGSVTVSASRGTSGSGTTARRTLTISGAFSGTAATITPSLTGTKTFVTGYPNFSGGGSTTKYLHHSHTAASLGTASTGTVGISGASYTPAGSVTITVTN